MKLKKILSVSGLVASSCIGLMGVFVEPAQAHHSYKICNKTGISHTFTLYDWDNNTHKNYSIRAGKCWEYWGYESIGFYNNFGKLKTYNLYNNRTYNIKYRSNGVVDIFTAS